MANLYHNVLHSHTAHDHKTLSNALEIARAVRENAYAPYSNFSVGAAIKLVGYDQIFQGCNIENASYGATICAERIALTTAISTVGAAQIDFILLAAESHQTVPPCALCLQVISEFANDGTVIYLANTRQILTSIKFLALLPYRFAARSMPSLGNNSHPRTSV